MKQEAAVHPTRTPWRDAPVVVVHTLRRAAPLAVLALVAWGCERSPAEPSLAEGPEAAQALEAHWAELASMEEMHLATAGALASGSAHPAGVAEAVVLAGMLAAEAGSPGLSASEARSLSDDPWVEITALRLGAQGIARYLGGIRTAIEAVEAAEGGAAFQVAVAEARHALATADQALASGQAAAALAAAAEGGDALRAAFAQERAEAFVAAAFDLLDRATSLAGGNPSPEIRALLDDATDHCQAARAALDAGDVREAVRQARECARISRMVIARLSGGLPNDVLAERAEAAVDQATALLERATEVAGPSPRPNVQQALDEARALLGKAVDAFHAEDYREAIRAAHQSGALSRRVIAWSSTPGGDGLEARALAALETATALLEKAGTLAGPNPPPAVRAFLDSASALVGEAKAAFAQGDFRVSLAKSLEAASQLRRAIHLLG
jgi:hypothetical protein